MIDLTDQTLLLSAKKGDLDAYNQLVLRHQKSVYNVAYRMLGCSATAADMAQEAFVKGYRAITRMQSEHFRAWIMRVVTNCCLDEIRRNKRRPTTSLDAIVEENNTSSLLVSRDQTPEEVQIDAERVRQIEHCLSQLPDEQRIVIILRDIQGYSYAEICQICDIPLGTVKSRISRARTTLQLLL